MRPIPKLSDAQGERFRSRVAISAPNECWEWKAGRFATGYGCIKFGDQAYYASRVAYFLATGVQPAALDVCHRCDNPACCNPRHLFLGTDAENMAGRDGKGRQVAPTGEAHGRAKLTERDVQAIRCQLRLGRAQAAIGREFGVTGRNVGLIAGGKTWRHCTEEVTP